MKQPLIDFVRKHHIGSRLRFFAYFFSNRLNVPMLRLLCAAYRTHSWLRRCSIVDAGKNNVITIGHNCRLSGLRFYMTGDNNAIRLGNNVCVNASKQQPTFLNACLSTSIRIDDDCLLSNSVEIHTLDYHPIFDNRSVPINPPQDVHLGQHCWIGLRALILKGVDLSDNTIVGAGSVVTRSVDQPFVIIAGNPARIVKSDVHWED